MRGGGAGAHCRWQAGLARLHTGVLGQAVAQRALASSLQVLASLSLQSPGSPLHGRKVEVPAFPSLLHYYSGEIGLETFSREEP